MAKGQHKSDKEQYSAYKAKSSREINRLARAERHQKRHPNDLQKAASVKDYKNAPNTPGNFPDKKDAYHDPVTGQPIAAPSFSTWTGDYEPIPSKRKGRNAKAV